MFLQCFRLFHCWELQHKVLKQLWGHSSVTCPAMLFHTHALNLLSLATACTICHMFSVSQACESYTLTAELQRRIQAMEMRSYHKQLHISYRPCYQQGSPCQDPAGDQTTWRPPDHNKEMQTAVVWSCLPFIRYSERGKKTRQTEEEVGRQHQEWTGLEFAKSQSTVENRERWRKLDAKSSVVPQQPSRLRDRWWW